MPSGLNAFEISDIQEGRTYAGPTGRSGYNNLHCAENRRPEVCGPHPRIGWQTNGFNTVRLLATDNYERTSATLPSKRG
jgi:hypothetical protein